MAYGFDADQQMVWIDSLAGAGDVRYGVLCRRHADAMVVPLGWMLDDRRDPVPRLFRPDEPVADAAPQRARRTATAVAEPLATQLQLGDEPAEAEAEPEPEAAPSPSNPNDGSVAPWKPVFDQTDDLDGLLGADSPLLSRAFRGRTRRG
jgi:hypothetical protein